MIKSYRALVVAAAIVAMIVAATVALLETALFHINPFKLGFRRMDYGRYFVQSKTAQTEPEYGLLAAVMSKNESAVDLKYKASVQIILCERQSDLNRYRPLASAPDRRNAAAIAPWPNTIYVTPKVKDKPGSFQNTLGHELSHILLIQNYGVIKSTVLWRRAEWIPEGFATYLNDWPYYFDRTEIPKRLQDAGIRLSSSRFPSAGEFSQMLLPLRFMIYRHFVEYLYQRNRSDVVVQFLKDSYEHPLNVGSVFERSFGASIDSYWKDFWNSLVPRATG